MKQRQGFRASEVIKITGLTQRQLDHWDRTNFIKPSIASADGRGKARFYSFTDLVQLRVAKELRSAGISLQSLREIMEYLQNVKGFDKPLSENRLIVKGKDVVMVKNQEELISALNFPGQGVLHIILDLSDVVEDVNESLTFLDRPLSVEKRESASL